MKYCQKCGKQIHDEAAICIHCGCYVDNKAVASSEDAPSAGFAALGFFFPLIGLILYLVWQSSHPMRANSAGKGALFGFIAGIVLTVIISCSSVIMVNDAISYYR